MNSLNDHFGAFSWVLLNFKNSPPRRIKQLDCIGISFLDADFTDDHRLGLYCLNNGIIVQTMLPFHKCCRIYEIKASVICEIRVKG